MNPKHINIGIGILVSMTQTSSQNDSRHLFDWLLEYHYERNLYECLPHMEDGQVKVEGKFVEEGAENKLTKGALVVADGPRLVEALMRKGIVIDRVPPRFQPVAGYDDFVRRLNEMEDGAFVYDGASRSLARVRFANSTKPLNEARRRTSSLIPSDFIYSDGRELSDEDLDEKIGTKTDMAIHIPAAYGHKDWQIRAYLLKTSGYGSLGMGKVAQFGPEGLEREIHYDYDQNKGEFFSQFKAYQTVHDPSGNSALVKVDEDKRYCPRPVLLREVA